MKIIYTVQGCRIFQYQLTKNKKIIPNAYFLKIQNMCIYISYELFWHMPSDCKKKQVKLAKIDDFIPKSKHQCKKMTKYTRKK